MTEICVVHLVRAINGIEPLRHFLESYDKHPAGVDHDLVFIFKGFSGKKLPLQYHQLLKQYRYYSLFIRDYGFDIRAYMVAAKTFKRKYKYFLFLNSFSEILDNNWLFKMYHQISKNDVGLVGATGSYQSIYTDFLGLLTNGNISSRLEWAYVNFILKIKFRLWYDPFPNHHIRTNAFMVSGDILHKIKWRFIKNKTDAWRFESGKSSLTKQIMRTGKKVIVVGKDGIGYEKEDWHKSNTFWQNSQNNLLISDNQTRHYSIGDDGTKRLLTHYAWGNYE